LVLSRETSGWSEGVYYGDLNHILCKAQDAARDGRNIFVIGGASVYNLFMERALLSKIYLTRIDYDFSKEAEKEAIFFPEFERDFKLERKEDEEDENYRFSFETWIK
jgi:dihydrofolate reductase